MFSRVFAFLTVATIALVQAQLVSIESAVGGFLRSVDGRLVTDKSVESDTDASAQWELSEIGGGRLTVRNIDSNGFVYVRQGALVTGEDAITPWYRLRTNEAEFVRMALGSEDNSLSWTSTGDGKAVELQPYGDVQSQHWRILEL